jgi:hypothetical protein
MILRLQAEMEKNCMFKQEIALDGHDLRPLSNICYLPDPHPLPNFKTKYQMLSNKISSSVFLRSEQIKSLRTIQSRDTPCRCIVQCTSGQN